MAQDVTIQGATYLDVPAVDLPKVGGGTARFYDAIPGDNLGYGLTDNTLPIVGVGEVEYMVLEE